MPRVGVYWALATMGMRSLVYGVIELPPRPSHGEADIESALDSLPETDEWPFLVRGMFSQTASRGLTYEFRIVHFGASLKEIENDWSVWVEKFEFLLSQLHGVSAVVHLESEAVGDHRLEWASLNESGIHRWQFLSGPRSFDVYEHT